MASTNNLINYDEEENWDVVNTDSDIVRNEEQEEFFETSSQIHEISDSEDMWDMGPRTRFGAPSITEVGQYDLVVREQKNQNVSSDVEQIENMENKWNDSNNDETNNVTASCKEENWDVVNAGSEIAQNVEQVEFFETKSTTQIHEINNSEDMWDMGPRTQFEAPSTAEVGQYDLVVREQKNQNVSSDAEQIENIENTWNDSNNDETNNVTASCKEENWDVVNANSEIVQNVEQEEFFETSSQIHKIDDSEDMWDVGPKTRFGTPSTTEVDQYDLVVREQRNQNVSSDVEQIENMENTWNDSNNDETNNVTTISKDVEPQREVYIPPEPSNDEHEIFGTGISFGINFEKLNQVKVDLTGENISTAINSFEELNLDAILMDNIRKSGYTKPTKIQKYSIPVVMAERDLMACAQTGSGKTAAFLIPTLNKIISEPKNITPEGYIEPQVIIISPTRELALQIYHEARKFSFNTGIHTEIAYGGTSVNHQLSRIQKGCHILVATPGHLNAFVKRGIIKFSSVRFLVLDEADRMLDMGFLSDMESILNHPTMVPAGDRRTLMFSATFPEDIQKLAANFLQNYIFVTVGNVGGASTDVQQAVYEVKKINKRKKLIEILNESKNEGTLVFVETKLSADFIAAFLNQKNIKTTSIHGDRLQSGREEALRDFRSGKSHVLVATSVAARGLDMRCVKHVINYDLPKNIDDYVHRIGRTGRIGNLGKATSFYDRNHDSGIAVRLAGILEQAGQNVPQFLLYGQEGAENNVVSFDDRDIRQNCDQVTVYEEERWDV